MVSYLNSSELFTTQIWFFSNWTIQNQSCMALETMFYRNYSLKLRFLIGQVEKMKTTKYMHGLKGIAAHSYIIQFTSLYP